MPTLQEHFSSLFSIGLELEKTLDGSEPLKFSSEAVFNKCKLLLTNSVINATNDGKTSEDIDNAKFAIVSWLDEIMAKKDDGQWRGDYILQLEFYNTHIAGDIFYDKLDEILAKNEEQLAELCEVYYLVLCNGFLGRYYINPNDPELLSFKAKLLRRLPEKPVDIPSLAEEHITPQPYTPTKLGEPILPMWCGHNPLNLLLALAIAIPIAYVVFKVLFDQNSLPDASISEASVSQVEKKFDCSNLNFTINQESKAIAWNGYVKSQEDLTRLETETKQISTVMQVELHNVVVHNWPICEALEVLSPHYGKNPDLKVSTSDKMVNFKEFDIFSVEVIAPTNIPYLYVEYFQREDAGNASVVHMYENYNEVHGNPIIVDKTLDGRKWEIRGPFGEEMIAVIGSDNPLFLDHAHLVQDENTRDYLSKLRKTLSGHTAGVYAFYFFINSREK